MAPRPGLCLKLYHENPTTSAPYTLRHRLRHMGRFIKEYRRAKSPRVHVFLFHNKESYESAINSTDVINLIEELGFRTLSDDQKRAAEDARTVFVKKLDPEFFYNMFQDKNVQFCENLLFEELKNNDNDVEKIRVHKKSNPSSDFSIPTTMVVLFKSIEKALEWVKEDTVLPTGDIYAKDKQMHRSIGYDICTVCRTRNCSKYGRRCMATKLCANCLRSNCQFEGCQNSPRCNNCNKKSGHTTGSSICPKNREYAYEKRSQLQHQKQDREILNGNQEAVARQLIEIRKNQTLLLKQSRPTSYAAAASPSPERPMGQRTPEEMPRRRQRRLFSPVQNQREPNSSSASPTRSPPARKNPATKKHIRTDYSTTPITRQDSAINHQEQSHSETSPPETGHTAAIPPVETHIAPSSHKAKSPTINQPTSRTKKKDSACQISQWYISEEMEYKDISFPSGVVMLMMQSAAICCKVKNYDPSVYVNEITRFYNTNGIANFIIPPPTREFIDVVWLNNIKITQTEYNFPCNALPIGPNQYMTTKPMTRIVSPIAALHNAPAPEPIRQLTSPVLSSDMVIYVQSPRQDQQACDLITPAGTPQNIATGESESAVAPVKVAQKIIEATPEQVRSNIATPGLLSDQATDITAKLEPTRSVASPELCYTQTQYHQEENNQNPPTSPVINEDIETNPIATEQPKSPEKLYTESQAYIVIDEAFGDSQNTQIVLEDKSTERRDSFSDISFALSPTANLMVNETDLFNLPHTLNDVNMSLSSIPNLIDEIEAIENSNGNDSTEICNTPEKPHTPIPQRNSLEMVEIPPSTENEPEEILLSSQDLNLMLPPSIPFTPIKKIDIRKSKQFNKNKRKMRKILSNQRSPIQLRIIHPQDPDSIKLEGVILYCKKFGLKKSSLLYKKQEATVKEINNAIKNSEIGVSSISKVYEEGILAAQMINENRIVKFSWNGEPKWQDDSHP